VYDTLSDGDGLLILIDGIWSRGMSKVTLIFGAKEEKFNNAVALIAPSDDLFN
jgi:uncharacterized protein YeaO (DUF488 family)